MELETRTPCSNSPFMMSGSIISFSSISRTLGPTTSDAKRRTIVCQTSSSEMQLGGSPDSCSISSSSVKVSNEFNLPSDRATFDVEKARHGLALRESKFARCNRTIKLGILTSTPLEILMLCMHEK